MNTQTVANENVPAPTNPPLDPGAKAIAEKVRTTEGKLPDTNATPPEAEHVELTPEEEAKAKSALEAKKEAQKAEKRQQLKLYSEEIKAKRLEKDRLKAERTRMEQDRALFRNEEGRYRSLAQAAKEDPVGFLEQHGVPIEDVAERVVQKGQKLTPEQQALRIAQEAKKEADELRKALEEDRKARTALESERARTEAQTRFYKLMMDADKFPSVAALWSQPEVQREITTISEEAYRKGRAAGYSHDQMMAELSAVDDDTLASILETRATAKLEAYEKVILARQQKAQAAPKAEAKPTPTTEAAKPGPGAPTKAGTSRTLTNAGAAQKASADIPLDRLPEHEQNRILAERMRAYKRENSKA